MSFKDGSLSFRLHLTLLMKLREVFSVLQDLVQELLMSCFLSDFLSRSHVLLEAIECSSFFLVGEIYFVSSIEVSIQKLAGIDQVTHCKLTIMIN